MLTLNKPQTTESENVVPDISQEVLKRRCLLKDPDGNVIETPEQMYMRVAKTIAGVESQYDTQEQVVQLLPEIFYKMMADGKFLPCRFSKVVPPSQKFPNRILIGVSCNKQHRL